jgi:hypothetical protein
MFATAANRYQAVVEEKVRLEHPTENCSDDTKTYAVLLPPINFIFKLLQSRATISVWLYENLGMRIEGKLRVRLHGK